MLWIKSFVGICTDGEMFMVNNQQFYIGREHYRRSVLQGWLADRWGKLTGRATDLVRFADVAQPLQVHQQISRRIQSVPLDWIVGSVGRAHDFTRTFLPRPRVDEERWAQLDAAFNAMVVLPPVELYQIGAVYFVRDGHHRISVARVNGLRDIEADVVELKSPVDLHVKDFQCERWKQVIKQVEREKEKPMFDMIDINPDWPRQAYAERLQQVEHERLVQKLLANQPRLHVQWLEKLGDLLIAVGTGLKGQPQQKFV
jgi:hypothetical protein